MRSEEIGQRIEGLETALLIARGRQAQLEEQIKDEQASVLQYEGRIIELTDLQQLGAFEETTEEKDDGEQEV